MENWQLVLQCSNPENMLVEAVVTVYTDALKRGICPVAPMTVLERTVNTGRVHICKTNGVLITYLSLSGLS